MNLTIAYLKDYKEYIAALAQWSFDTWSQYDPNATRRNQIQKYKDHCNIDRLPLALIALDGFKLVGMCSLRETEDIRPDLTPWLSSLYVVPSYRQRQVGQRLVDSIKRLARSMDYKMLHLLTFEPNLNPYFIHQGGVLIGRDLLNGYSISIMALKLIEESMPFITTESE
jgi:GNAT superfamily N-acetyltransferase